MQAITLTLNETIDTIGAILGIALFFLIGMIFLVILKAFLSKLFNVRIVNRSGQTLIDPETFDGFVDFTKAGIQKIFDKIKKIDYKSYNILNKNDSTKIEKLTQLMELRKNNIISEKELEILKKEVIK
jgi:mevalonate kinase